MSTQGRVVAVTGAGQGLGRAIAVAFSDAGFDVALFGRTQSKLDAAATLLKGRSLSVVADLTAPDQVRAGFARMVEALGGLDVLVNNAGGFVPFPIDLGTDDEILNIVQQNFLAPIYCIREAIGLMRARGAGDIVNITSQSAQTPQPHMIVYGAAKAGVEALSRGLRAELRGEPIRVMTLQPGVIAGTELDPAWADRMQAYAAAQAKGGMEKTFAFPGASPQSIAAAIVHAVCAPRDICLQTIEARGA
jgi:NAD(P)-dependent dehydrogenase (short-subunit alcohol dehydrogenase family)